MEENNNTYSPILELLTVANEYCFFIEKISSFDEGKILDFLRKILPLLYVKGSAVKAIDDVDDTFMQRYVTEEMYENIFNDIRNKIGSNNVFYTFDEDLKESVEMNMSECLTDIYQDLKDVSIAYINGIENEKQSAQYCLNKWFVSRWGLCIAKLMPFLHYLFEKETNQNGIEFD